MVAKIFLAPVAQPDAEFLRDALAFLLAQPLVELHRLGALSPAGGVIVILPTVPRHTQAAIHLFDQSRPHQRRRVDFVLFGGHFHIQYEGK